ncbi:MAG TPA: hypothetical protein VH598_04935 [Verrucomicrobiae bacterium]|nr:hypothetical protein [Verrucomicrobiae bacterium]
MDNLKWRELPTHRLLPAIAVILGVLAFIQPRAVLAQADVSANRWWPDEIERAVARAGTNQVELTRALIEVPEAQRSGLKFLLENMPQRDLQSLTAPFLL